MPSVELAKELEQELEVSISAIKAGKKREYTHPNFTCRVCGKPGTVGGHLEVITGLHANCYDSIHIGESIFMKVTL